MFDWLFRREKKDTWTPFKTVSIDRNQEVTIVFEGSNYTLSVDHHRAILNTNVPLATVCELRW